MAIASVRVRAGHTAVCVPALRRVGALALCAARTQGREGVTGSPCNLAWNGSVPDKPRAREFTIWGTAIWGPKTVHSIAKDKRCACACAVLWDSTHFWTSNRVFLNRLLVQVDYGQRKGEWEWLPTAASLAKLAKLAVAEVDVPGSGDGGTAGGAADGRETAREAAERRTKIPRAPTPTQREYCQQVRQAPPRHTTLVQPAPREGSWRGAAAWLYAPPALRSRT